MSESKEILRLLAELRKTPSDRGGYRLCGRLTDGHRVEVFASQRKRRADDADFLLVTVVTSEENPR